MLTVTARRVHLFRFEACAGWVYVLGIPGKEEELRCSCGDLNLNLRKK